MMRGNLHTHSTYCDGKSTLEETVQSAIEKGFSYIGFSGHENIYFDGRYCMSLEGQEEYRKVVNSFKEKYKDKILVLCGLESDIVAKHDDYNYDYVISSTHYIKAGDGFMDVDESKAKQNECIDLYYGGDPYAYAEEYYKTVAKLRGDIIGHFDLLTKFDRNNDIFNPKEERYKKAALSALDELLEAKQVFEVNTGAMSRGYKDAPYPDRWILEEIKKRDGRVLITSDCHHADNLDYGYELTEKILTEIGFKDFYNIDFLKE